MAGLIGTGQALQEQSSAILGNADRNEQRRNEANKQIESQETSQRMSMAGTGASIGMYAYGPLGALAGAAAGYLIGSIF